MKNYNFEYKYSIYSKTGKQREYKVPIRMNIDNTEYNQEQREFLISLYPNGLNKQIQ
ncbi:hypothetical protein ES707_02283 [subsurface metagenome]